MEKVKNKEDDRKKRNNLATLLIVIIIVLVLAVAVLALQLSKKPATVEKKVIDYKTDKEWYKDDCKCVEWKGEKVCPSGFQPNGKLCATSDNKTLTNYMIACSKYECDKVFVQIKANAANKTTNKTI